MLYLVFGSFEDSENALATIYANMLAQVSSQDLLNVDTQQVVIKDDLTLAQAVEIDETDRNYPIFGVNAQTGIKDVRQGYTTAWAKSQQRVTDNKWVAANPGDALMTNVQYESIEPYDPAWFVQNQSE